MLTELKLTINENIVVRMTEHKDIKPNPVLKHNDEVTKKDQSKVNRETVECKISPHTWNTHISKSSSEINQIFTIAKDSSTSEPKPPRNWAVTSTNRILNWRANQDLSLKSISQFANFTSYVVDPVSEPSYEVQKKARNRQGSWIASQPSLELPNRASMALREDSRRENET